MTGVVITSVPPDHPSLAGHFPGHPIVPGVVLVELAERAARATLPAGARLAGMPAVKFLRPVRPGEPLTITVEGAGERLKFSIAVAGATAASGTFRFEPSR